MSKSAKVLCDFIMNPSSFNASYEHIIPHLYKVLQNNEDIEWCHSKIPAWRPVFNSHSNNKKLFDLMKWEYSFIASLIMTTHH